MEHQHQRKTDVNNLAKPQEFETDAERLTRQHMEDEDHSFTEEEIAGIRVGLTPPPDQTTREAVEEAEERAADHKADSEDDVVPGGQKATPWDVLDS